MFKWVALLAVCVVFLVGAFVIAGGSDEKDSPWAELVPEGAQK